MKRRAAIALSGFLWLGVGIFLLYKGLRLISTDPAPRLQGTTLVALGLLIGFVKGRLIFPKTVRRVTSRIQALSEPIPLKQLYPLSYWILIGSMVGIGVLVRFLPTDIRGFIDVAIGSALVNGAMLYFRAARQSAVLEKNHLQ